MFNIGIGEILFIAILALVFIGPERLPGVLRQMGEVVASIRKMASDFNSEFADELKPIRELQSLAADIDPRRQIGKVLDVSADVAEEKKRTIAPPTQSLPSSTTNPMAQITQAMSADDPAPRPQALPDAPPDPAPPAAPAPESDSAA